MARSRRPSGRDAVGHFEQKGHLLLAEMRGQMMILPRRADQSRRVAVDVPLLPQVPAERPNPGELSRRGRPGIAALVQVAEEGPDVRVGEVVRCQVDALLPEMHHQKRQELRDVAFIGADRVRRRVVVEGEVLEKAVELFFHGVPAVAASTDVNAADRPAIQSSSAASARVA